MIFAAGLHSPEGPVALPDGSWLVVESGPERGCVTQIGADGRTKKIIQRTGRPNGLAIDNDGTIWVAESKFPSLLRLTMDGQMQTIATACDGEPFLFPNDLCFGPDGAIYLTDSGILTDNFSPGGQIRADYMDVDYDGRVYRVDPNNSEVIQLDGGLRFTNGIAFGPDGLLYVNETLTGNVYRYRLGAGPVLPEREFFGNVIRPDAPAGWKGPDGMAFDRNGLLYVAVFGQGDVTVLGSRGEVVQRIPTQGQLPTNVAFALPGEHRILVTEYEHGRLETFPVDCDGLPLWDGSESNNTRRS